ncbi:unnamed protein product [Adineta ricciae]|uniref:Uncharacterized protein n=1 Tax=Adineta ricciae TaxID=249248 RepID=A0A815UTZ6_ADIRI|nr:unnamed protein product [Adineta ricciae]
MTLQLIKEQNRVKSIIEKLNLQLSDGSTKMPADFGFLKFDVRSDNCTNNRLSQFIHVDKTTTNESVAEFIIRAYRLPIPDLILSIQTDGVNITNEKTKNTWVMTNGSNQDIIRLIGSALQNETVENDIPCIGFTSWKHLSNQKETLRRMNTCHSKTVVDSVNCELEPNHTHFILFSDELYDLEKIPLRRQMIERQLSRTLLHSQINDDHHQSKNVFRQSIPIVMLLLGGHLTTLITLCEGLKNETPIVTVLGTGYLADIIARLCLDLRSYDELMKTLWNDRTDLKEKLKEKRNKDIQECRIQIERLINPTENVFEQKNITIQNCLEIIIKMQKLIVVFDGIGRLDNLEDAIADALRNEIYFQRDSGTKVKDGYDPRAEELKWCLIWNKEAHGELEILINFEDENTAFVETKRRWINKLGQAALFEALCRNNIHFVDLLMDNGASVETFSVNEFKIICEKTLNKYALNLDLTKSSIYATNDSDKFIEEIYKAYLWQYLEHYVKEENSREKKSTIQQLIYWNNKHQFHSTNITNILFNQHKTEALYLWLLFMKRPEMAKCLCSKLQNQTVATLLAAAIYFKAAKNNIQNRPALIKLGKEFDRHAKNLIDECFSQDKSLAHKLIHCKAPAFYHCTPLDIARRADCRRFLASDTVQRHVDQKWYHHFDTHQRFLNMPIYVWVCILSLLLPLIPIGAVLFPSLYKKSSVNKQKNKYFNRFRSPVVYQWTSADDSGEKRYCAQMVIWFREIWRRILYFYEAPVVRFYYHAIFFFVFLTLFSYVLLVDYFPLNNYGGTRSGFRRLKIPISEILLHISIWTLIIDASYELTSRAQLHYDYVVSSWNLEDVAAVVCYLIGFIARFFMNESAFIVSKVFMSVDLILWSIRLLHLFSAYESLGPKLMMISRMIKDAFLIFVFFILILLLAFSVTSWSLLSTNTQVNWIYGDDGSLFNVTVLNGGSGLWTWQLLRDVLNWGIWKVFGQIDEPFNNLVSDNDVYGTVVFLFAIIFVVISNVLLMNVLVAMFNVTIQRVLDRSHRIWRHQRFLLVYEYSQRPVLPAPLSVFYYIFQLFTSLCGCYRRKCLCRSTRVDRIQDESSEFSTSDTSYEINYEKEIGEIYWKRCGFVVEEGEEQNNILIGKVLEKKIDKLNDGINRILQKYSLQKPDIQIFKSDIESSTPPPSPSSSELTTLIVSSQERNNQHIRRTKVNIIRLVECDKSHSTPTSEIININVLPARKAQSTTGLSIINRSRVS